MVKENKLFTAVKSNNPQSVLKVLEKYTKSKQSKSKSKKIDFDLRDNHGLTVIHHAARNGSLEILEILLIHGSRFDVYDLHGLRPISYACAEGHYKIVDYLLRWGSNANRISAFEYLTPLHLAAMYGYAEIAHLLLRYKADVFAMNRDNKIPIDLACAYGKYNVINLLFSYTTSIANKNKSINSNLTAATAAIDCYGSRTPQSDQITRCSRFNQPNVPTTPKVERYSNRRSSSPYGSSTTNSSGSGSAGYNNGTNPRNRVVRNISFIGDTTCNSPCTAHPDESRRNTRVQCQRNYHNQADQQETMIESSGEACFPPTLDDTVQSDIANDLRQNLKEACFGVQARARFSFSSDPENYKTISFEAGDLITVLKQYHNGLAKGFVTSEGISSTGLFPLSYIEYISDRKPPTCCDRPLENFTIQSPEKTPIPNRDRCMKDRPSHLDLKKTNNEAAIPVSSNEGSENGSPIIIPPQMTDIRTSTNNSALKWSTATSRCPCDNNPGHVCYKRATAHLSPDLPSVSTTDLTYCLSLVPGFISGVTSSSNKRNSIASLDSGRGSATDTKSVVSGSTPASSTCNKGPTSPIYYCPSKTHFENDNSQCICHGCGILPPTVPMPFHHDSEQQAYFLNKGLDTEYNMPNTNSYSQKVSIDSLYYPSSMISLDETQYSSGSSDRGVDDIMVNWLYSIGLGSYADVLSNAGYDLATLTKATPEDLNASGVTNPKDRQFLKNQLSRLSVCDGLPESMPASIHDFLDSLKLLQYEELLSKQNYTLIEHLLGLTWEDLADIGVQRLGHQKKLSLAIERLSRLSQSNSGSLRNQSVILNSPQKFGTVPQSRSFEELPYPAAIMADQDSRESLNRQRYKGLKLPSKLNNTIETGNFLLSKSDESVSSVTEIPLPRYPGIINSKQDNVSLSSSTSSCSQESSKDDSRSSQSTNISSASHFAHENVGTVRIKRPILSLPQNMNEASWNEHILSKSFHDDDDFLEHFV